MAHDRKFRFAVQLTHAATGAEWLDMARQAERDGFSVLSLPDHLGDQFAPLIGLAAAAAVTSKIRFSNFVLANDLRNPGMLAKEIATLDLISNGRVELGIGAGWDGPEYKALGVPFDSAGRRIERLAESVTVIRRALSEDKVSFAGKHYTMENLSIRPRPVQKPVPILMGGGGPKMLGVAARNADIVGIALGSRPRETSGYAYAEVAEQVKWVREAAGARFADLELNIRLAAVAVEADRVAAAQRIAATPSPTKSVTPSVDELLTSPFVFLGTEAEIEAQIRRTRDELGISYFTVSYRHSGMFRGIVQRLTGK